MPRRFHLQQRERGRQRERCYWVFGWEITVFRSILRGKRKLRQKFFLRFLHFFLLKKRRPPHRNGIHSRMRCPEVSAASRHRNTELSNRFRGCFSDQSPKTDNFTHIAEVRKIVRKILTAQFEFVQGVLAGAFRIAWCPPAAIAKKGEAAIQQYFEIKHNAAPGTYRFLEQCRALKVEVEHRIL